LESLMSWVPSASEGRADPAAGFVRALQRKDLVPERLAVAGAHAVAAGKRSAPGWPARWRDATAFQLPTSFVRAVGEVAA
jgi:hypothetical protein